MKFFRNNLGNIFFILLFLGVGYYYRGYIGRVTQQLINKYQPCQRPITYSIASIDSQFGISKEKLLSDINRAENIWEASIGKQLFEYSPTGDLKISLIYDDRQKATDVLRKLGIAISADKATYNTLKAKYDSLVATYDKKKAELEILIDSYDAAKSAYEKDVHLWNSRGGAPKPQYDALQQRLVDLNNQADAINKVESSLNELADTINSTASILNKVVAELNLQGNEYNTVGASTPAQFQEGEYVRDSSGTAINIYQFDNEDKLVRVLAHELGHALGLEHINNSKAIMYYLNEGVNEKLTADDLVALKEMCGIK